MRSEAASPDTELVLSRAHRMKRIVERQASRNDHPNALRRVGKGAVVGADFVTAAANGR